LGLSFNEAMENSMLDQPLLALVTETKTKLNTMKDARPSEHMAVVENFQAKARQLIENTRSGQIPDNVKIEFFDILLTNSLETVMTTINDEYEDEDTPRYVYESVVTGTLGRNIYKAINEIPRIIRSR
jgi:hypothetical protein